MGTLSFILLLQPHWGAARARHFSARRGIGALDRLRSSGADGNARWSARRRPTPTISRDGNDADQSLCGRACNVYRRARSRREIERRRTVRDHLLSSRRSSRCGSTRPCRAVFGGHLGSCRWPNRKRARRSSPRASSDRARRRALRSVYLSLERRIRLFSEAPTARPGFRLDPRRTRSRACRSAICRRP